MRTVIKSLFSILIPTLVLIGCSNKINQTGGWLVSSDSTLVPTYFNSVSDSTKVTTSQVNYGLATGSSESLILGKVPWTEADLLIRFSALDPVDSAQTILSTTITLYRTTYVLEPPGEDINQLRFVGFPMDTFWNATTYTWDSVNSVGHSSQNIITSSAITDTSIVFQIDTGIVRQWVNATMDSTVKNNGFIIKPQNIGGILSVYGPAYATTGYVPSCTVTYIKDGVLDTSNIALSYATAVAKTSIESMAPPGPYRFVQAGTGERLNVVFDLSRLPRYCIVNRATLTLSTDSVGQFNYAKNFAIDTLVAYYMADPSTGAYSVTPSSTGYPAVGSKNVFDVTTIVQHMLNSQNYGFMILEYSELDNANARFVYDENAPDSLKPMLSITYTPTSRR